MLTTWRIAAVQIDADLGGKAANLARIQAGLREAAAQGANLVVFPECILTGYCFSSKEEAWPHAEMIPGPSTQLVAATCRELRLWAVVGMLEAGGDKLYNTCALVGPSGPLGRYRKIHLPYLGVDRFTTPGDQPFAVHELAHPGGGPALRLGMTICYDGSFPESARCLMLLGADLVVLPTNWPAGARSTVRHLVQARALENHIYYAAVDRIGTERGFQFLGMSRLVDCNGELLAASEDDEPAILYADIDPERARNKAIVHIPGQYELHRTAHRRPEMYGPIVTP